jgi:hypothetical protein
MTMRKNDHHIWVWLQDYVVYKAVYNYLDNTFLLLNEHDEIILKYTGITTEQIKRLTLLFCNIGAKPLNKQKDPFIYL